MEVGLSTHTAHHHLPWCTDAARFSPGGEEAVRLPMRTVILAGGAGNRLGGETEVGPKPLIEVGGHPLLWHIMSRFELFGLREFVVAVGHRGELIKRYFAEFGLQEADVTFNMASGETILHHRRAAPNWRVDVIDTGRWTDSAGRVLRVASWLDGPFLLTFGDILSDVDLTALVATHRAHGRLATLVVVHPQPRFGQLILRGDQVTTFSEKPMDTGWINGGIMVMELAALEYIDGDDAALVPTVIELLSKDGELAAYRHEGFWRAVDSMRDKVQLEDLWADGSIPWLDREPQR